MHVGTKRCVELAAASGDLLCEKQVSALCRSCCELSRTQCTTLVLILLAQVPVSYTFKVFPL